MPERHHSKPQTAPSGAALGVPASAATPAVPASAATPAVPASAATPAASGWHVVYTRPRQEQVAEENLIRQHYDVWLPTIGKWVRRAAGWTCETQPMFPRYLFMRTTNAQQNLAPVRSTRGAVGLVRFGERAPLLADEIVGVLRRLAAQTREPTHPLRPGARVRVVAGPLTGLQALVTANAARRVEIFLSLLGRDTRVSVHPDQLVSLPA